MQSQAPPPELSPTATAVAVAGHPVHPMLVTFPIAFLMAVPPSDIAFLYFGDPFWARLSLWLLGAGTLMGTLAGIAGTVELLAIAGIRRRAAAWNHFVAAVVMLAVSFANWTWRLDDVEAAVAPWGLAMSALTAVLVVFAGWLGGGLVFEHQVGIEND
ncbi:MAG TPA: DUF2231 domain-containing protein [Afifellaceae bacterium]|nr:DUF2231 domain-containing protein [Afifellaceae bacterium]